MRLCLLHHDNITIISDVERGMRHYATSWKVAGSIPDEVIGFFD
jgi:hypothetical protein